MTQDSTSKPADRRPLCLLAIQLADAGRREDAELAADAVGVLPRKRGNDGISNA